MIEIKNLMKRYGNFLAVNDLNLTIPTGEIFGFVGPNGAGKTTTMKIMAGLLSSSGGQVIVDGFNILSDMRGMKDKIGYMPDFFGVYDNLKVDEYLDFYGSAYYIEAEKRKKTADNLLELVGLESKRDAYVDTLSRGMKQRLCLARSLIHDPQLLILDEPASGLDPRARHEMKEILKLLKTLNKTIIISSHILTELAELCTSVGIISSGSIVASGSIRDIMEQLSMSRQIVIRFLGASETLIKLISQQPLVEGINEGVDTVSFEYRGGDEGLILIIKELVNNDIPIVSFSEKEGNLEELFMHLTGGMTS